MDVGRGLSCRLCLIIGETFHRRQDSVKIIEPRKKSWFDLDSFQMDSNKNGTRSNCGRGSDPLADFVNSLW